MLPTPCRSYRTPLGPSLQGAGPFVDRPPPHLTALPDSDPSHAANTVRRAELVAYLDRLLDAHTGSDYCPNGLQVEGGERISSLVTGVSACHDLFVRAREIGAQAILVHHGILWRGASLRLTGIHGRRLAELIHGDLSLLAYHLPLDRHAKFGNNALACRAFGLDHLRPFGEHEGLAVGFQGTFPTPIGVDELQRRCQEVYGQEPLAFLEGPDPLGSVGIVSGAAESSLYEAIDAGLDAFITGEASEWVMNVCREAGIHFLAAGHYATERLGIQALGDHVADHFGIDVQFIDIPNPV